jgi:uncharacterized protein YigE (DUF2233 family)
VRSILFLALLLCACGDAATAPEPPRSACSQRNFEGSRFTVCAEPGRKVELRTFARNGRPLRTFAALEQALGNRTGAVAFAMNAGMFDEAGRPIGLLVEEGKELRAINRRKGGGNFHLLPNGVFLVRRDGKAEVVTSEAYKPAKDILFASQSGPMLVIGGKLHPAFEPNGESKNIRNGVGIAPDGTPLFVISEDFVSFGKFARFYRDALNVRDALYFDGSVSSLWDPAEGRRDIGPELGPMVVVFKAGASKPGRGGLATP